MSRNSGLRSSLPLRWPWSAGLPPRRATGLGHACIKIDQLLCEARLVA